MAVCTQFLAWKLTTCLLRQYLCQVSLLHHNNTQIATCHIHAVIAYKKQWKYYIGRKRKTNSYLPQKVLLTWRGGSAWSRTTKSHARIQAKSRDSRSITLFRKGDVRTIRTSWDTTPGSPARCVCARVCVCLSASTLP